MYVQVQFYPNEWNLSQCDVMTFKTVAILIHGGRFNQEKSIIFRSRSATMRS